MGNKYSNEKAFYDRMRSLANVNEGSKEKNAPNNLGTLINYKRGADNVAYGIVKENHNYFIKKSNKQTEPNIEDFAYIGGLPNIHEYRYNKLSEADKNRTMMLNTINEALKSKGDVISEGKKEKDVEEGTEEELAAAEEKLDSAEEKAEKETEKGEEPEGGEVDIDSLDVSGEEGGEEETPEEPESGEKGAPEAPEGGEEEAPEAPEGGEENGEIDKDVDKDVDVDIEGGDEPDDEEQKEIQKLVGKLTNKFRNTDLTPNQVQSYLNSFISSFEDELPELEVEERKAMANKLMKVNPEGEEELSTTGVEDEKEDELGENKTCNECGFAKYAESRGYDEESIMEADEDEIASLMNGYALQQEGELNEEDLQSMALFSTPEVQECLAKEYGNDTLPESLKEYADNLNEQTSEDKKKKVKGMFWWNIEPQKKKDVKLKSLSEEDLSKYENMSDDELAQLDEETLEELNLRGVGSVAKYLGKKAGEKATGAAKGAAQKAGTAAKGIEKGVKGAAGAIKGAIKNKLNQVTQSFDNLADEVSKVYSYDEVIAYEKKLQEIAKEFGKFINKLDQASQKAGHGGINKHSVMMTFQGMLKGSMSETAFGNDPVSTEVQPNMQEREDYDEEQGEVPGEQDTGPDEYGDEEINSAKEFKEYANKVLKQAHGEEFDPEKAEYFIDSLVKMVEKDENEDWGAAVGILQQSLDESLNEQNEKDNDKENDEEDVDLTPGFEAIGGGVPKPDGANIETEEAGESEFDIKDSTVNINMSESERRLRKYIRNRLEEKAGRRKPTLNENQKSNKIKALDKMIDEQYSLFQSIINENEDLSEILTESNASRFKKLNPNDEKAVNDLFNKVFKNALNQWGALKDLAAEMSPEDKYKVMKQGMEVDKLRNPAFTKKGNEYAYRKFKPASQFKSGGTGGKTSKGGV